MKKQLWLVIFVGLMIKACGTAGSAPGINVTEAWVRPPTAVGSAGAAYFVLNNTGSADDTLLSVTSEIADHGELHESKDVDGMMQMQPVDGIVVPANGSVTLEPGGYHVMLMGFKELPQAGDTVTLILTFEKAGTIEVTGEVAE